MSQTQHTAQMPPPGRPPRRRGAQFLSTLLFIAAIVFAGIAIYLFVTDGNGGQNGPAPPPSEPGRAQLVDVTTALRENDLSAEIGNTTAHSEQLGQPGQAIHVEDERLFVFFYSDPETRQEAAEGVDADTIDLRVDPEVDQELHLFQSSNVVAVLVADDADLAAQVEAIIESIP